MNKVIEIKSGTKGQIIAYFCNIMSSFSVRQVHKDFFKKMSKDLKEVPGNGKLYEATITIL